MIQPEVIETLIRMSSGGIMTDENKLDRDFVAFNLHAVRADAIINWLLNPKNGPHDLWYQMYTPIYQSHLQEADNCVTVFKIPVPINLPGGRDGIAYFGTDDGYNNIASAGIGAMESVYSQHRVTNRMGLVTRSWRYSENGYAEMRVKGNKLFRRPLMKFLAADPTSLETFRPDVDEYPITSELFPFMIRRLFDLPLRVVVDKKADILSDSQDPNNLGR